MSLFKQAEADRIAEVVGEVEQRTAGEIVVAEVGRSDTYADVQLFVTLVGVLTAGSVAHYLSPELEVSAVLGTQFGAGMLVWLITLMPPVLRALVPKARAQRAVERAAELAFFEHAVFATRDRTGVLVFLSAFEHGVVILGDEGIHARVQNPGWEELVARLVAALKRGEAGAGVCDVVTRLGELLARDAPIQPDDTNELDNRVRTLSAERVRK